MKRITENKLTTLAGLIIAVFGFGALLFALITNKIDSTVFSGGIAGVVTVATLLLFAKGPNKNAQS